MFLSLTGRLWCLVRLIPCTGEHRSMILNGTDHAWMVGPVTNGRFEDYSLVVALALALGFDAIGTSRALLATLDTAFATRQATSLGPFAHLADGCRA